LEIHIMKSKMLQAGLGLVASLVLVGCGGADSETTAEEKASPSEAASTTDAAAAGTEISGVFAAFSKDATAVTYNDAVPKGAKVKVSVVPEGDKQTVLTLEVAGLASDHGLGAHLHAAACGADPADAGPHYQNEADPKMPSTNSKYANKKNEVWLDFTTDTTGTATATATVDWLVRPGEANSIVIHAEHTKTSDGEAGTAGDRLACVNVPL
jgi:Cu-Zn family superoxide dismutase